MVVLTPVVLPPLCRVLVEYVLRRANGYFIYSTVEGVRASMSRRCSITDPDSRSPAHGLEICTWAPRSLMCADPADLA